MKTHLTKLQIRVVPGAKGALGISDVVLYDEYISCSLRIIQKPIQGKANESVITTIAKILNLPQSYCTLQKGTVSKHKEFVISSHTMTLNDIYTALLGAQRT